jgi:hydrogenase maturation protein HypF
MALAWLHTLGLEWEADLPPVQDLCYEERTIIRSQIQHNLNAPLTSSMGRLFDAISALIGIRQIATYEGQAAIELEALADPDETGSYPFELMDDQLMVRPMLEKVIQDWRSALNPARISAKFHNTIALASLEICKHLRERQGISTIALSGGVWQNRTLFTRTVYNLETNQFTVLRHHQVPVNDGCIALGQALVAAHNY